MQMGLAISTYFPKKFTEERLEVFKSSVKTLLVSSFDGPIFLVDDGSDVTVHLQFILDNDKENKIKVHLKKENTGIARTKNTSIRLLLDSGCDICFLADDDVIYKRSDWFFPYVDAISKTKIPHFSFFVDNDPNCKGGSNKDVNVNGFVVTESSKYNGAFITVTKQLIEDIGYFKILPYKYGYEHVEFSKRCLHNKKIPFICDVKDSYKYLKVDVSTKSFSNIDKTKVNNNSKFIEKNYKKEICIE